MNIKSDSRLHEILLKFLKLHFPIQRIKEGKRFKRGIIIPNSFISKYHIIYDPAYNYSPILRYFLTTKDQRAALYGELQVILQMVFAISVAEIATVLYPYLH